MEAQLAVDRREPLAYTVRECASALRVSERTVHRLIRSGALGAVRISRCVRVPAVALTQFLERGGVRVNVAEQRA